MVGQVVKMRNKYGIPLGIEVASNRSFTKMPGDIPRDGRNDVMDTLEDVIPFIEKVGLPVAFHLPEISFLSEDDLRSLTQCLKDMRPVYAVVHGPVLQTDLNQPVDSSVYIDFWLRSVALLRPLAGSGIEVLLENVPPFRLSATDDGTWRVHHQFPVGILALDQSDFARASGLGVLFDTEHSLQSIFTLRSWNSPPPHMRDDDLSSSDCECLRRFGFFIRDGRILVTSRSAMHLFTFDNQLSLSGAKRFHITGSKDVLDEEGHKTVHAEILDAPFHNYLIHSVLKCGPTSITVQSCRGHGGKSYDVGVAIRSLERVARYLSKGVAAAV